jgi:hypothetical protein
VKRGSIHHACLIHIHIGAIWSLIAKKSSGLADEFFIDKEVLLDDGIEYFSQYVKSFIEEEALL